MDEVVDGEMVLSEYGRIVDEEWHHTAQLRPYVTLDAFVVMPNHIHGILWIEGCRGEPRPYPPCGVAPGSLGTIVGAFKSGGHPSHQPDAGHPWCSRVATQLLGTHYPQRAGSPGHPTVHPQQPSPLALGPLPSGGCRSGSTGEGSVATAAGVGAGLRPAPTTTNSAPIHSLEWHTPGCPPGPANWPG